MQTTQRFEKFKFSAVLFVLFFPAFVSPLLGQTTAKNVIVTLYVNTAQITNNNNKPTHCNFGQPANISNEDFTTTLNVGDSITWVGVSSNAPDKDIVNITSINYRGGTNVFQKNVLPGNGKSPEQVLGKVVVPSAESNCKYSVSFTVFNNGVRRNGTFMIDPKLEVH